MELDTLLRKATEEGMEFSLRGNNLHVERPENFDPFLLASLKGQKEEIKSYFKAMQSLNEFIPGSPKRQNFRRRVIDRAGMAWHQTPLYKREAVISKYLQFGDVKGAAQDIIGLSMFAAA